MTDSYFTVAEFNAQIVEFRKMFGSKDFWALSKEKRDIACQALSFAYMHLALDTPKANVERCFRLLEQHLFEYCQRKLMLVRIGKLPITEALPD